MHGLDKNMSKGGGGFTAQEKELLAPYVTNTEGSVFALTNLPEVIKGALFSRYSRSSLGLRQLLLKDFIRDAAAEFGAITGAAGMAGESGRAGGAASARESHLAVRRAQDFYDRILDGYGDDSIGELGGAHLAIENVSMIATKVLQDARIGGSPLEKSTRYVSFAEKQDGDFLFYKEPALMASSHRETYLATCRALFQAYAELIEPLADFIRRAAPRPEGFSEAAYNRSVKARALDALRGLLPAATLTNMGIFGNGRFFETLLIRLQLSGLGELNGLGGAMGAELGKIIPSFIRRAGPAHPHFAGFQKYQQEQRAALRVLSGQAPPPSAAPPERGMVELVEHDADGEAKVLAALLFPEGDLPLAALRKWAAGVPGPERARIFREQGALRRNRRHKPPRALEAVAYTFDLVGDFGMYRDMHRHRMLTQTRQLLSTRLGYEMSEEIEAAGLAPRFREMMERAEEAYEALAPEFPEQAQYVVPMAYRIRWAMQINLRALMWLTELRSSPQGHPAYRRMAQQMYLAVKRVHPGLAEMIRFVNLDEYPLGRLAAEQRQEEKAGSAT